MLAENTRLPVGDQELYYSWWKQQPEVYIGLCWWVLNAEILPTKSHRVAKKVRGGCPHMPWVALWERDKWKQTCSSSGGDVTSSLKTAYGKHYSEKWPRYRAARACHFGHTQQECVGRPWSMVDCPPQHWDLPLKILKSYSYLSSPTTVSLPCSALKSSLAHISSGSFLSFVVNISHFHPKVLRNTFLHHHPSATTQCLVMCVN